MAPDGGGRNHRLRTTTNIRLGIAVLLAVGTSPDVTVLAQSTEITSPVVVRLAPQALSTNGGGYVTYKYGIYAAMGGSTTPQLYEFDTGGNGFYAVIGGGTNSLPTPAWGPNVSTPQAATAITYSSGNVYSGNSVYSQVAIYSAINSPGGTTNAATASIFSKTNTLIGQVDSITNSRGNAGAGSWPNDTTPPVDGHFYGDFGMALKFSTNGAPASSATGIMSIVGQLDYATNVIPGFILNLVSPGSTDASVQFGLDQNYLTNYPIRIAIAGRDTNQTFPGTTVPTYSGAVISNNVVLNNGTDGTATNSIPVVLDTGATPELFFDSGATNSFENFTRTNGNGDIIITDNTALSIFAQDTNGVVLELFNATTGVSDFNVGVNYGTNFSLNIGQELFYRYEIAYDLQDGILALRPIPEPNQVWLMLYAVLGISGLALLRTAWDWFGARKSPKP